MLKFSMIRILGIAAMVAVVAAIPATAGVYTLADGNSVVKLNTETSDGVFSWKVDQTEHMFQQWFWYRIGSTGAEQSIDTMAISSQDGSGNSHTTTYMGDGFTIEPTFVLTGGAADSGQSSLGERIMFANTGDASLDFHFYQYVDFNLNGTAGGDTVKFMSNSMVQQYEGDTIVGEEVLTPEPVGHEAAYWQSTLIDLADGDPTTLNNQDTAGPGDVTWAFQWDFTLAPGETYMIIKEKTVVPVPSAVVLGIIGLSLAGWIKKRFA